MSLHMEIQETPAATTRQIIHLQVAGEHSQEDLVTLITQFQQTALEGGVIATPENVIANVIHAPVDLAGMVLTPKMTALEIAAVVVEALRGLDIGQGIQPSPTFVELEQNAKIEILNRIQFVLRFGALPPLLSEGEEQNKTRDAIFEAVARSLGSKLAIPNEESLITVTRIAQKEGDEDFDVSFKEIVQGDIFKHAGATYLAESNPYMNWIAHPLPVLTLDAKQYQAPEPVAPEDVKQSAPSKKKVQSKPSKSTAKPRKK